MGLPAQCSARMSHDRRILSPRPETSAPGSWSAACSRCRIAQNTRQGGGAADDTDMAHKESDPGAVCSSLVRKPRGPRLESGNGEMERHLKCHAVETNLSPLIGFTLYFDW